MKNFILISVVFISCIFAGACKKGGSSITGGGSGGTNTIKAIGEAHGYFLDTCIIYIKYNAQNAPENGIYDDSLICKVVNDTPFAVFSNLTTGNYYLFAVGYHGAYSPPNVEGGKTVTISGPGTVIPIIPAYAFIPPYPYILP